MARSTWGNITQKKKGVWEIRYPKPPENGKRKQGSETIRGTKKEAEKRLAELRVEYEGVSVDMTLNQFWVHEYWPSCEDLAPSTRVGYERVYSYAIKPVFGDMPLRSIGPKKIQAWIDGMSYGAARGNRAVLRTILSYAETKELVDSNAAMKRFKLPKKKPENAKRKVNDAVFTKEELDNIFSECEGEIFEAPFILAGFGGARREEACGVKPCEVEYEEVPGLGMFAIIPVRRGVQNVKGKVVVVEDLKTKESRRWLIVPPPYSVRIKEICEETMEAGEDWLIEDGFGNLLNPDTMAAAYKRWFQNVPLCYVPFQNLRNSYATVMHALGIDLSMVQKLMGHTQLSTTFSHYDRPGREEFIGVITRAMQKSVRNCEISVSQTASENQNRPAIFAD